MGKYTVLDDPIVDQTVEDHMRQIVTMIRSRIEPRAIILRGSFSQGEGSVVVEGNDLRFLSDYELMAVTRHRRWLRTVARQMTTQLGVETSISRIYPHVFRHNVQPTTIVAYELQSGGCTLYGKQLLNQEAIIDPRKINLWEGLRLMLNRMAESMDHLSPSVKDWEGLRWVNKTLLSCAEALLIAHQRYHYSYAERGRRFADLVPELDPVAAQASQLFALVQRATAFKLRPSFDLYPEPMPLIWEQVKQACDVTFRYVIEKYLGFSFSSYAEFPARYLQQMQAQDKLGRSPFAPLSQNLYLVLRLLRDRRRPPLRLITDATYPAYQIAFSIVPLLFLGDQDEQVLQAAHHWLGKVSELSSPRTDALAERDYLQRCTVQAWKDFCYGMWSVI